MIDETGYTPQVLIGSEPRNPSIESAGVPTCILFTKKVETIQNFGVTTYFKTMPEEKHIL